MKTSNSSPVSRLPVAGGPGQVRSRLGHIAHELRAPLATIRINIEVALLNDSLVPDIKELLHETLSEVEVMSHVIDTLLDRPDGAEDAKESG